MEAWKQLVEDSLKEPLTMTELHQASLARLKVGLVELEKQWLQSNKYLCGNEITFPDLLAFHLVVQFREFGDLFDLDIGSKLLEWVDRIQSIDSTAGTLSELRDLAKSPAVEQLKEIRTRCAKHRVSTSELKQYERGLLSREPLLRPVVLSGPSGVGKSTLIGLLKQMFPESFSFSVSHTTRKPRPGEEEGVHYYFVSKEQFDELVEQNAFIEHASFAGNSYGTSYHTLEVARSRQKIALLDIDVQGIKTIKQVWNSEKGLRPAFVQIVPPSYNELRKRLVGRGDTSEEAIQKRLVTALNELTYTMQPDFFDYVVVNDDLEIAVEKLARAINDSQLRQK